MAALSLIPFALLMMTSLRAHLGGAVDPAQRDRDAAVPPTQVLTGLALILTLAVMAPTGERMYRARRAGAGDGGRAPTCQRRDASRALAGAGDRAKEPLREFLLKHTDRARPRPRSTRWRCKHAHAGRARRASPTATSAVIVPAFVTSELRRAFEIGFLLFIPFLVVDMVIANLLLALGMHMLSPTTVSLPFKLLLFVLADGWHLVIRGLRGELPVSGREAELVLRAVREGLLLVLLLSGPPLLASLVVGFVVGLLQAATQIQDQTLAFVPKLVVVMLVLAAMGPVLGAQLVRFTQALFLAIPSVAAQRRLTDGRRSPRRAARRRRPSARRASTPVIWLVAPLGGPRLPAPVRVGFALLLAALASPLLLAAGRRGGARRRRRRCRLALLLAREVAGRALPRPGRVGRVPRGRDRRPARPTRCAAPTSPRCWSPPPRSARARSARSTCCWRRVVFLQHRRRAAPARGAARQLPGAARRRRPRRRRGRARAAPGGRGRVRAADRVGRWRSPRRSSSRSG